MAYTGSGHEDAPSIDDVEALQARLGKRDQHIVWLGEESFIIAHTDEERATIDLKTCPLHEMLLLAERAPVEWTGYYAWLPDVGRFEPLAREALGPNDGYPDRGAAENAP